ncbi:versican core protein-like [Saccostrea echinata]|uniref:versican core protein-like n=1 Tax=Saccostrea echinata TaxID=191078 RepID=UPI002A815F1E|nr:versican core protein-like [Saccostrea echinata]
MSLKYNRIYLNDDKSPSANVLVQHSDVFSLSECALIALNNLQCSSFFFNKATSSCTLTGQLCASQLTLSFGYQHFLTDSTVDSSPMSCAYEYIGKNPSWSTAKMECENRGGYLVELQSQNEQQFVRNILIPQIDPNSVPVFWLGGKKTNGQFEWINGGKIEYSNWRPGYPDNQESNVDCRISILL